MATSRFADLPEDEMEEILNKTESRNTKNVIQVASKLFKDYKNNKLNLCRDDLCDKSNEKIVQRNIVPCPKFDKNLTSIGQYF